MPAFDPRDMGTSNVAEQSNKRKEPSGGRELDRSKDPKKEGGDESKSRRSDIQGAELTWKEAIRELATASGQVKFGEALPKGHDKLDLETQQVKEIDSDLSKIRLAKTTREQYKKQLAQYQLVCKAGAIQAFPASKESTAKFGRALIDCPQIPSSRSVYLSEVKNGHECSQKLSDEARLAYSNWFKGLDVVKIPGKGQAPPLTLEMLIEIGRKIKAEDMSHFHREGKLKRVETSIIYGVLVSWWFTFMRPDDLRHCERVTGSGVDADQVGFNISSSKVDQAGRGWKLRYACACNYDLPDMDSGVTRMICPVHSRTDAEWKYAAEMPTKILASVFTSLMGRYISEARLWTSYSIRVGGCRAARMSLPQDTVVLTGRWRDANTANHYSNNVLLNPDGCRIVPWPLVVPRTFGPTP